jgi:hypothetical protein
VAGAACGCSLLDCTSARALSHASPPRPLHSRALSCPLRSLAGGPLPPRGAPIADLAFDPSGRRLAALLRPPHPAAGLAAVFSTTTSPVVHAELVGFARPFAGAGAGAAPPPAALAFAQRPGAKAVLSVMGPGAGEGEAARVANIALAL